LYIEETEKRGSKRPMSSKDFKKDPYLGPDPAPSLVVYIWFETRTSVLRTPLRQKNERRIWVLCKIEVIV